PAEPAVGEPVDHRALRGERPWGGRVGRPAEVVEPAVAVHAELRDDHARTVVTAREPQREGTVGDVIGDASKTSGPRTGQFIVDRRGLRIDRPRAALGADTGDQLMGALP